MSFHDFLSIRESKRGSDPMWFVSWPGNGEAKIFFTKDDATEVYNDYMEMHTRSMRDLYVEHSLEDPDVMDNYKGIGDEGTLRKIFQEQFDLYEDPRDFGDPPNILGPFVPASSGEDAVQALKDCVWMGNEDTARDLIVLGVDPLLAFKDAQHVFEFFDGDISWMPEGPTKSKLLRMQKGKSAFGM